MTRRFLFLFAALTFLLAGCGKDNDDEIKNEAVESALYHLYPDASHLSWDYKGQYVVVEFIASIPTASRKVECEAWFDNIGNWFMTEFDIRYDELPSAVAKAFESGSYSKWYVEDVERLDREGYTSVYIIQVEDRSNKKGIEYELYYDEQGVLVKEVADGPGFGGGSDLLPPADNAVYAAIREFIKSKYPNGRIADIEPESNGYIDVEIIDNRISKDLLFDSDGTWLHTSYEVSWPALPKAVQEAFNNSQYKDYYIDDIDYYETAENGNYYRFALESIEGDIKITIREDGSVSTPGYPGTPGGSDNPTGNPGVNEVISQYINLYYPGAKILDSDKKGGYTEVEIFYEGKMIELFFNGSNQFVRSERDVKFNELPDPVKDVIRTTYENTYDIDDIELVETTDQQYYKFDLEKKGENNTFITVNILPDGTILN